MERWKLDEEHLGSEKITHVFHEPGSGRWSDGDIHLRFPADIGLGRYWRCNWDFHSHGKITSTFPVKPAPVKELIV